MIEARAAAARNDFTRACEILRPIVQRDSMDADALFEYGDCQFHDLTVEVSPKDTALGRFRGSWAGALAAFRRVRELEPGHHPAYLHILDALTREDRRGCVAPVSECGTTVWWGFVLRDADTLVTIPQRANGEEIVRQLAWRERTQSKLGNLAEAAKLAQEWSQVAPDESTAWLYLGRTRLRLGHSDAALRAYNQVRPTNVSQRRELLLARVEALLKLGRGAEARANFDSLARDDLGVVPALLASLDIVFGHFGRWQQYAATSTTRWLGGYVPYYGLLPLGMLGVHSDTLIAEERRLRDTLVVLGCDHPCLAAYLTPTLLFDWRSPRSWRPNLDTTSRTSSENLLFHPYRVALTGDTARLRRVARWIDSIATARRTTGGADYGVAASAAETYLAVGDSAGALRVTREFLDQAMPLNPMIAELFGLGMHQVVLWPRAMLLRADLAARLGYPDEARLWYARLLDLWSDADASLQPTVARIRNAMAPKDKP